MNLPKKINNMRHDDVRELVRHMTPEGHYDMVGCKLERMAFSVHHSLH